MHLMAAIFDDIAFWALLIPITAILTGGIIAVVKMLIRHQERLAMIERGMHPDYPPDEERSAQD